MSDRKAQVLAWIGLFGIPVLVAYIDGLLT